MHKDYKSWCAYINLKKKTSLLIQIAKQNYYLKEFSTNSKNIRKLWKTINEALSRNKQSLPIKSVHYNQSIFNDPIDIANAFNLHFTEIAGKLNEELPAMPLQPLQSIDLPFSFYFSPISTLEIEDTIKNLKVKKSSGGLDNFTTIHVKLAAEAISNPLCLIFIKCIQKGVFPAILKVGKVNPTYKAGVSQDLRNYRPNSLLSGFFLKCLRK